MCRTVAREEAVAAGAAMMAAVQHGLLQGYGGLCAEWFDPQMRAADASDDGLARDVRQDIPVYVEARKAMRPGLAQPAMR